MRKSLAQTPLALHAQTRRKFMAIIHRYRTRKAPMTYNEIATLLEDKGLRSVRGNVMTGRVLRTIYYKAVRDGYFEKP